MQYVPFFLFSLCSTLSAHKRTVHSTFTSAAASSTYVIYVDYVSIVSVPYVIGNNVDAVGRLTWRSRDVNVNANCVAAERAELCLQIK